MSDGVRRRILSRLLLNDAAPKRSRVQLNRVGQCAGSAEIYVIVYWALFLVPALGALVERERPTGGIRPAFLFSLAFVFFIIAFRETGGDWYTYNLMFELIRGMSFSDAVALTDPAYGALNWLSDQLGWGLYGVNAVCALIFLVGFARFSAPEARSQLMLAVATSYLIIVVVVGYTRQGTAIGVELLALRSLMGRRFFPFLAWASLAMAFHRSAEILLPLGYFAAPRRTGWLGRILAGGTVAAATALFANQFSAQIDHFYAVYVVSSRYNSEGALIRGVMNVAAALAFLRNRRHWAALWDDQDIWLAFSLAAIAAAGLGFVASTAADRVGLYVIPLQIIVFARLPALWRRSSQVPVASAVAIYALALGVWLNLGQFASVLWLPYKSLIFGVIP